MWGRGEPSAREVTLARQWCGLAVAGRRVGSVVSWSFSKGDAALSVMLDAATGQLRASLPTITSWDLEQRPVLGPPVESDAFVATARWARDVAQVEALPGWPGDAEDVPPEEVALQQLLNWLRRQASAALDPFAARLARRFAAPDRLAAYRFLVGDPHGRVAQLLDVAPGVLLLAVALERTPGRGPSRAGQLIDGVRDGKRLDGLLDRALGAWFEDGCEPHARTVEAEARKVVAREQRWLVRRAGTRLDAAQLLHPLPVALVPEDLPNTAAALQSWLKVVRWFEARVAGRVPFDPGSGLLRFVMRYAASLHGRDDARDERDLSTQLFEYVFQTGRVLDRTHAFDPVMRAAYAHHVNAWRVERYPDDLALGPPDLPLPDDPLFVVRLFRTAGELRAESEEMHHCVATYVPRAAQGHVLGRADIDGRPVTFDLEPGDDGWHLVEAKGLHNRLLSPDEHARLLSWVRSLPINAPAPEKPPRAPENQLGLPF